MQTLKSLFVPQSSSRVVEAQNYENFHSMAFTPMKAGEDQLDENAANEKAKQIFEWAIKNGAKYYTFFGYPQTQGVLEKQ